MGEAILAFLSQLFLFATKVVPDDKIREEAQQIRKQRVTSEELIRIYDREFRRLKNHTEINIATDVSFADHNLPDDQRAELINLLTARILEYRKKFPLIFRKWLLLQSKS